MGRNVLAVVVLVHLFVAAARGAVATVAFTVTPVVRDFHSTQTDFEIINWNLLTPTAWFANNQSNKIEKGIAGPLGALLGVDGVPVYSSAREPGFYNTVSSASSFALWFADIPANVRVIGVTLPFTTTGDGNFTYSNTAFFPLDGKGFGAEGFDHNYHFTARIHEPFHYAPGQNFSVIGDDDAWVFIDHKLVIDAGGVHGTLGGSINLDTLALTAGGVYDLDVFFAERNRFGSALIMTTNIPLPEPASAGAVIALAIGLMWSKRRPRKACG